MSAEYEIDMSIESVPSASEVECESEVEVQEEVQLLTLELMMVHLPSMDPQELLELMAAINTVLKKKWKSSPTKKSVEKVKKPAPKALKRNQAWIAFTLKHAMDNGWEAYTIHQETKNKTTGETVPDDTARSGSVPNDADTPYTFKDKTGTIVTPAFIYEDTGKHFIYKEAMSLSAQWKWTEGARPAMKFRDETEEQEHWSDLFREFIAGYEYADAEAESESSSSSSTPSSPVGRRLTAAEREEERAEKRRIAEEEKEVKRQAREEKKEESRQKKEQEEKEKEARRLEREEKKAEKDRLELEKKAEKEKKAEAKKSPPAAAVLVKRSPVPAAKASTATKAPVATATKAPAATAAATASKAPVATASKAPVATASKAPVATASKAPVATVAPAATAPAKAKAAAPKQLKPKMTFDIEEDSLVHDWTWEGQTYLVNSDKCVWEKNEDGEPGEWVGMVDLEQGIIDTSVPEPPYDDE